MKNPPDQPTSPLSQYEFQAFIRDLHTIADLIELFEKMPPTIKAAIIRQFIPEVKHLL